MPWKSLIHYTHTVTSYRGTEPTLASSTSGGTELNCFSTDNIVSTPA